MMRLPPPANFAEGQRKLYGLLASAAGMFCGATAVGIIAVLVWGGWPTTLYGQIITILGSALIGFIAAMSAVIIGLMVGGPVGRFKGTVNKDGASLEAEGGATTSATANLTVTSKPEPLP